MRIGVDLGGTKIEAIALDEGGRELKRLRAPTPAGDYEATVRAIADLVRAVEAVSGGSTLTVGVGIPGTISPATGLVKNSNSISLIGHALDKDLEAALGRKVRLANDANCFALSEAVDGAAMGAGVVFGAILGTGTGGGIVVRGQVIEGANRIAGEWGHNPLPWLLSEEAIAEPCYCGRRNCTELFLSGPGLARDYQKHTGKKCVADQIAAQAQAGESDALKAWIRYEDRLARALATVINFIDPNVVVFGGGLSNVKRLYENVPKLWGKYVFSDQVTTRLVQAKHGDSSGVRGAAWLWTEAESKKVEMSK